jgi:uncharacterized protein (TIGR02186 family)
MRKYLLALLLLLFALPAGAEELVSGLSQDLIEITSNYTGTDIVVFGAIEQPDDDLSTSDVIVVVRGPPVDVTVHEKQWTLGLWINRDRALLKAMPAYYFLASTRPLARIATTDTLQRYDLGLANIEPERIFTHHPEKQFLPAAIRYGAATDLYAQQEGRVEFLSPTLFRVRVPVPASVPRGAYNAEVYLFRDGHVISAQSTPLFIDQTGIERRLFDFAHNWPFLYGLATVVMAAMMGWISSILFRKAD